MQEEFNTQVAGSFYSIGDKTSALKVVLMHGHASNAELMKPVANMLLMHLPEAHIVVPNGCYKLTAEMFPEAFTPDWPDDDVPFTWKPVHEKLQGLETRLPGLIEGLQADPDNRIHLLGFSMGGFQAAEEILKNPDKILSAVVHSGGIINVPQRIEKQEKRKGADDPGRLLTLMGLKDPYLRQKWALALLPVHYNNQWKANRAGIKSKTGFIWDLAHDITETSVKKSAKHIAEADQAYKHS